MRWKPIRTAPQDGSKIRVKCVYGVRPYYEVVHWGNVVAGMDMGYGVWITERGTFFDYRNNGRFRGSDCKSEERNEV